MFIFASSATTRPSLVRMNGLISAREGVSGFVCLDQRHHGLHRASYRIFWDANAESQLPCLKRCQPDAGLDDLLEQQFRRVLGDFLDLHATGRRRHEDVLALRPVQHDAEIRYSRSIGSVSSINRRLTSLPSGPV